MRDSVLADFGFPSPVLVFQLINQKCAGDMALVEMLVNSLLGRLVDNSHVVRKLCIRGLGNVASNGPEQVSLSCFVCPTKGRFLLAALEKGAK